jgi:hypothetical protein
MNKDITAKGAKQSLEGLIKCVQSTPPDKWEWVPMGKARTILSMMQEVAGFPRWIKGCITEGKMPESDSAKWDAFKQTVATMDQAIAVARKETDDFGGYIMGLSDDDINKTVELPWGTTRVGEILSYHEWNNTYHLGQVNYIQLLYGDEEMHF